MVAKLIEIGDTVELAWLTKGGSLTTTQAIVLRTPRGEGGSWQVQGADGRVSVVNVYCYNFVRMTKVNV
jgi:hypothetical protein